MSEDVRAKKRARARWRWSIEDEFDADDYDDDGAREMNERRWCAKTTRNSCLEGRRGRVTDAS